MAVSNRPTSASVSATTPGSRRWRGFSNGTSTMSRIRPGFRSMTTMRSDKNTASATSCVNHEHGDAFVLPDAQELGLHLTARQRVERAERLVEQENLRPRRKAPGDRCALSHAAGELVRIRLFEPLEPDQCEETARDLALLFLRRAALQESNRNVRFDREPREQAVILKPRCRDAGSGRPRGAPSSSAIAHLAGIPEIRVPQPAGAASIYRSRSDRRC